MAAHTVGVVATPVPKDADFRGQLQQQRTQIEHVSQLDIYRDPRTVRMTGIVCTIGPSSDTPEMMVKLREQGMNIVRMNFSHGTHAYGQKIIDALNKSFEMAPGAPVAVALDTKGPEIRTGKTKAKEVHLVRGQEFIVTVDPAFATDGDESKIYVDYTNMPNVLSPGDLIYIDDGLVSLKVTRIEGPTIHTVVQNEGMISSNKGVNLPNVNVDLPALSEKDIGDLKWGVSVGIDMVFASFIRKPADVLAMREVLGAEGAHIKIVSKIENHEGMRNFDAILAVTDGIMVARGDLGIEIPPEKVFLAQKMMIARCNRAGKPVICATQMLESMIKNPRPTRAECTDIANAVLDGADCVMLSGETAKGDYPVECVRMMHQLCREAESAMFYEPFFNEMRSLDHDVRTTTETLCMAAVTAANEANMRGIMVISTSGETARLCAKYRPKCPVFTITRFGSTARVLHLHRGCFPLIYPFPKSDSSADFQADIDNRLDWAMGKGKERGFLKSGDVVVAIQGWKTGAGNSNTMRMLVVP